MLPITKDDLKQALDNCMWEHAIVERKSGWHPQAHAMSVAYLDMLEQGLDQLPPDNTPQAVAEAVARWKDHRRSPMP